MAKRYRDIVEYLDSKMTAVVSTISETGKPQSATVFYWTVKGKDDSFDLFFLTRRHTRKSRNLERDSAVAVAVGTDLEPYAVQIEGEAEMVEKSDNLAHLWNLALLGSAKARMRRLFSGEFFPAAPFGGLKGNDFAVYRVRPTWVRYMSFDEKKREITYREYLP
jgi:general stress protein 26